MNVTATLIRSAEGNGLTIAFGEPLHQRPSALLMLPAQVYEPNDLDSELLKLVMPILRPLLIAWWLTAAVYSETDFVSVSLLSESGREAFAYAVQLALQQRLSALGHHVEVGHEYRAGATVSAEEPVRSREG